MPLAPVERQEVRQSIKNALQHHAVHPFGTLREAGAVADLRTELLLRPTLGSHATVTLPHGAAPDLYQLSQTPVRTRRVQLEVTIKIELPALPNCDSCDKKVVDLAILGNQPALRWAANGPGDVIQQIEPGSVVGAIEVKASPSIDPAQRGAYVNDIFWLLALKRLHDIDGFFVLMDKSHGMYGQWRSSINHGRQPMQWNATAPQDIRVRKGPFLPKKVYASLNGCQLEVASGSSQAPASNQPYVEVWSFDGNGQPAFCFVW